MSILWIYDKAIDPQAGGTERATHLVMTALAERGHATAGFLVFRQDQPRAVYDAAGEPVTDLYAFLKVHDVHVVVNQIGYSKWLLEEFLARGGARWRDTGGRIVTMLHFDPLMFSTGLRDLTRHWRRRSPKQKLRRLGRIALLPLERRRAARTLRAAYAYLLDQSDAYVILSEKHRRKLLDMSATPHRAKITAIPNPNTFPVAFPPDRVAAKKKHVLVVSRLDEPQKRVSLALLAWGRAAAMGAPSGWTLKVLGDGDYRDDYRDLVARERIPDVEFIGRTDPEPYYDEAAIYLHTAKREGWGLTIAEAMQKGVVPVVMHGSPVFEELIEDGRNGILVENGNVDAFADRLVDLMGSRELRENMARSAIEASHGRDLDRIIQRWSEVLERT
ncbi:MAG: glycosyltransferase [Maritimibacter sp.]|nr:glycosyltransferase [Maritimibacter sp.]